MKFSIITSLCLIGSTFAVPHELDRRDDKKVREAVSRVISSINLLNSHFKTKPQVPQNQQSWVARAVQLQQDNTATLTYANGFVRAGPTLSSVEFYGLGTLTTPMHNAMSSAVNGWVAAKPYVVNVGAQDFVLAELQRANNEALGFANAIWSRTSQMNQALTNSMISRITSNMDKAINAYRSGPTPKGGKGRN